ncbi:MULTISPECIES: PIN domain nuclease [Nocardiopsis]|uniref:PIN domain nuclease n=1 Tax=Nocardiopsis TaxID=2013 RepID=UPI00034BD56B|nr:MULTISPECIES: PIN domain nuclease [Nocardiopsis]
MTPAVFLIDTSALNRLVQEVASPELLPWRDATNKALIAISPITELEFLHSARSGKDRMRAVAFLNSALLPATLDEEHARRAFEVQRLLTEHGEHRSAGTVDLLVAACAEISGLTLLHYDRDFETIAKHTGQPTSWLAPPGSL